MKKVEDTVETEIEIRDLEQLENNLTVEQTDEYADSETANNLPGLFANGFMTG